MFFDQPIPIPMEDDPCCRDLICPTSVQVGSAFEVSPALEERPCTPLSTHWIPLHELITHWTDVDPLLVPAPVAPLLTAIGHALLALGRESNALRLFARAWDHRERLPQGAAFGLDQVLHCLDMARREWALAAGRLESLAPTDLEQAALARARRLSRIARTQQARVVKLIEEVCTEAQTWREQHQQEARP